MTGTGSLSPANGAVGSANVGWIVSTSSTVIDLLADTDRSGIVDKNDEPGKGVWTNTLGAIYTVNYNADDKRVVSGSGSLAAGTPIPDAIYFNDNGDPEYENKVIGGLFGMPGTGTADLDDISPLVVRATQNPLPSDMRLFLKVAKLTQIQAIHVYQKLALHQVSPWGGPTETKTEIDITSWISDDATNDHTLGVEGLFLKGMKLPTHTGMPFDGMVDLTLELRQNNLVVASSKVEMKVAPWIALPNTQLSTQVWAAKCPSIDSQMHPNPDSNDAFISVLTGTGQLSTVPYDITVPQNVLEAETQWFQDHVEIGYTQRPGGRKVYSVFRLPYFTQPTWPLTRLLTDKIGVFQLGKDLGNLTSGDYGGNVELLPPTTANPLGRIVVGDTKSPALFAFFQAQEVQSPIDIPTIWLNVGHVDEAVAFDKTAENIIMANPALAYKTMQDWIAAKPDPGDHVLFYTGGRPQYGKVSSDSTNSAPNRLWTGIDLRGKKWTMLRIFSGNGAGQVAHIATLGNGFIDVDKVWETGSIILDVTGDIVGPCIAHYALQGSAPLFTSWDFLPLTGDEYVLVEGTELWATGAPDNTPAVLTMEEVLADAHLKTLTDKITVLLASIKQKLMDAASPDMLTYTQVPVLYVGNSVKLDNTVFALTPGLANVQIAAGKYYFAKQFCAGSDIATGADLFEAVAKAGLGAANCAFIDDWNCYHRHEGEVHCGTAVVRDFYAFDWWSKLK